MKALFVLVLIALGSAVSLAASATSGTEPGSAVSKGAAPSRAELVPLIDGIAKRRGVELALAHAIVAAESAYDARAVSRAGAIGLMQVMPATAADYGVTDPEALFDPQTNVETGVRHLRRLLDKYDNDYGRAIMAYNAGEGVVDRTNSNVTYRETLDYTVAVIHQYRRNGGTRPTDDALRKVALLRRAAGRGDARRLMKRYLDTSLLSLKIRPTLSVDYLDPGLHRVGPESRPMFELHPIE
ncbi:soluble lytic murein transglycosylase-like protein [Thioflavicoccus mobilis 8321]|uniref:Soluble lytic murein transglycosylase-like protein n=1 Tax=Thioflavicoccus mobilis 8321 TaxID=765912 RepID=L0GXG2_9GAMM|nr:lytic transglycosylase domain-containing protein [Thioflavicoccus mobilis]AGA90060.1 soluble lytic murein transglycosylase-like protein [Thioflavicoccus mobilis 8321]